jgi:hypothetical protein
MVHEAKGLDIEGPDALVLDSMEHDKEPDTMDSDAGPEVLCHNLLFWALLSWPLLSELWGESTEVGHPHLNWSDGIWELFWWLEAFKYLEHLHSFCPSLFLQQWGEALGLQA